MTLALSLTSKTYTYTNGNANDASQVDTEFTNSFNNDSSIQTTVNTIAGTDSTKGAVDGKFLVVRYSFAGTPASGEHCGLEVERGGSTNMQMRWNETNTQWEFTNDGTLFAPVIHKQFTTEPKVSYNSASQIIIGAGTVVDSTNKTTIDNTANKTIDITVSGAGGLDTGAEASSTWYYVYLIGKTDGTVNGVLSTVNEASSGSITMPSGYTYKRQIRIAIRNDGSSNIIPFHHFPGGKRNTYVSYRDASDASPYQVLNGGNSTTAFSNPGGGTSVDCSAIIPPVSIRGNFRTNITYNTAGSVLFVKDPNSTSTTGIDIVGSNSSLTGRGNFETTLASQAFNYRGSSTGSTIDIYTLGYWVTEI